jgi:hypothetical protein
MVKGLIIPNHLLLPLLILIVIKVTVLVCVVVERMELVLQAQDAERAYQKPTVHWVAEHVASH